MTVMENHNRFDKSNVVFKNGKIVLYDKTVQHPEMNAIDYGISVFERAIFEKEPENTPFDLAVVQTVLSKKNELIGCEITHRFYEIGTGDSLREFIAYAQQRWYTPNKAVFLDRDGVINQIVFNEDTEQLDSPMDVSQFKLIDGAVEGLLKLQNAGYRLFVVTNQPAAAKGKTTLAKLYDINTQFIKDMQSRGVNIEAIQMCPHFERATAQTKEHFLVRSCDCRKPKAGLINRILKKYNIDIGKSYMVGDSFTDILAGHAAKLKTVFIGKYKCDVCQSLKGITPDYCIASLYEVEKILHGK